MCIFDSSESGIPPGGRHNINIKYVSSFLILTFKMVGYHLDDQYNLARVTVLRDAGALVGQEGRAEK